MIRTIINVYLVLCYLVYRPLCIYPIILCDYCCFGIKKLGRLSGAILVNSFNIFCWWSFRDLLGELASSFLERYAFVGQPRIIDSFFRNPNLFPCQL